MSLHNFQFIEQDVEYTKKLRLLEGITIADMGVRKRFWLNDDSFEAEKIKVADLTSPLRVTNARRASAPTSPVPVLDLMSPIKNQLVGPIPKPRSEPLKEEDETANSTVPAVSMSSSATSELAIKRVGDALLQLMDSTTKEYTKGHRVELVQDEDSSFPIFAFNTHLMCMHGSNRLK
jgi:hypothetical protein